MHEILKYETLSVEKCSFEHYIGLLMSQNSSS